MNIEMQVKGKREKVEGQRRDVLGKRSLLLPFTFVLLPFVLLCTLNSAGYRYGASDLAFYIPAALERIDPSLFPRDTPLIASQAKLTMIDETIAGLSRVTGLGLPPLFATLYATTLALLLAGPMLLGRLLYRSVWTTMALAAALTLRHAIAKSGTNTLEGYFHPRQLAFSLGVLALVALMRRRVLAAVTLVLAGGLLHPTTALWFSIWIAVASAVNDRRWRIPMIVAVATAAIVGTWMLTVGPLAGRLVRMDEAWIATLETKDYLFPLEWPAYAWLLNLAYAPVILYIYKRRADAGVLVPGERGLVWGCLCAHRRLRAGTAAQCRAAGDGYSAPGAANLLDARLARDRLPGLGDCRRPGRIGSSRAQRVPRHRAGLSVPQRVHQVRSIPGSADCGDLRSRQRLGTRDGLGARDASRQLDGSPIPAMRSSTARACVSRPNAMCSWRESRTRQSACTDRDVAMRTRDRLAELQDFDTLTPERARALAASATGSIFSSPPSRLISRLRTPAVPAGLSPCDDGLLAKARPDQWPSDDGLLLGKAADVSGLAAALRSATSISIVERACWRTVTGSRSPAHIRP